MGKADAGDHPPFSTGLPDHPGILVGLLLSASHFNPWSEQVTKTVRVRSEPHPCVFHDEQVAVLVN